MQLEADWQLRWPQGPLELQRLRKAAQGEVRLRAQLPEPWPLPGVGLLQGDLALDLAGNTGDWLPRQLQADLRLSQPQGAWLERLPEPLRPEAMQLRITPLAVRSSKASNDMPRLPLALQLRSQGPLRASLQGELNITPRLPDWRAELKTLEIKLKAAHLQFSDSHLKRLNARLLLAGQLDHQRLQLTLSKGSRFSLGQLALAELRLEELQGELAGLRLSAEHVDGALHAQQLSGPLHLQTSRLKHPGCRPRAGTGRAASTPEASASSSAACCGASRDWAWTCSCSVQAMAN
ncbi:hypothetical protein ACFSHR_07925 [Azotobacter chroococcum]